MNKKSKKKLAEKDPKDYWQKKKHIMNQEEHDEFMKKTGKTKEEHDKWHEKFGGWHGDKK